MTSALARVEVVRALRAGGPSAVLHARRQLSPDQIALITELLDSDLRAVVTYDLGVTAAAQGLGLAVETPA